MGRLLKRIRIKPPAAVSILGVIGLSHVGMGALCVHFGLRFGWAFVASGTLCLVGAGKPFITWIVRRLFVRYCILTDQYIEAEVVEWKLDETTWKDGQNPYQLVAKFMDDTGTLRTFTSEDTDSEYAPGMVGNTVRVYTAGSFKFYYMDIGMLPE